MAECEVSRHLPSPETTLRIRNMVWGNCVLSDTKTDFVEKVGRALNHLKEAYRTALADPAIPEDKRFRYDDYAIKALKPLGVGYFECPPGVHFYWEEFFERFEYVHDTALLKTQFVVWTETEKKEFLSEMAGKTGEEGEKDYIDDVCGPMYAFIAAVSRHSRYRLFHREGKRFCGRLEYVAGFHPFPAGKCSSAAMVYIRDTLSLALMKAEYEVAEEILQTQGGWVYNRPKAFGTDADDHKFYGMPIIGGLPNTDPAIRDISHTACLIDGYFRQWFAPLPKKKKALNNHFLGYYLFSPDWNRKYRSMAESARGDAYSLDRLKTAIFDNETPTWLTDGALQTQAMEMAEELANRFIDYCKCTKKWPKTVPETANCSTP